MYTNMHKHTPAHKIADDVSMTDDDLVAVLLLLGFCSVDVTPERCLNSCAILVVLLKATHTVTYTHTKSHIHIQSLTRTESHTQTHKTKMAKLSRYQRMCNFWIKIQTDLDEI